MRSRVVFLNVAVALLAVAVACKSSSKTSDADVEDFVSGASAFGSSSANGIQQSAQPPAAQSGGPAVSVSGNGNAINGGSNAYGVSSATPFQKVFVSVNVPTSSAQSALGAGGLAPITNIKQGVAKGHIEIDLPAAVTAANLIVNFGRDIPADDFELQFQIAAAGGAVGAVSKVDTTVLAAATGDVQVTASWDAASDVDLHVQEPNGNEVFWQSPNSSTGGALDLDSNPGCAIDGRNIENIRWPTGQAPTGTYTVRLHYFDECNVAATNFVVTVNNGGNTTVFTGAFTGPGPQNGAGNKGDGRLITTFVRSGNNAILGFTVGGDAGGVQRQISVPSVIKMEILRRRGGR